MERITVGERSDWREQANALGYDYHPVGPGADDSGWLERAFYRFSSHEIDLLEKATEELHALCLLVVERVVGQPNLMARFGIPEHMQNVVQASWRQRRDNPEMLGRFDLAFDPRTGAVKMLEYNADTPTAAIETALMQWHWLQDLYPTKDQFNSLHEAILVRFSELKRDGRLKGNKVTFAPYPRSLEDRRHCEYYSELAREAGLETQIVELAEIRLRRADGAFLDDQGEPVEVLFKIYPWEMMAQDRFSVHLLESGMQLIEPAWKFILSNKALLPMLWEMFPCCPWLLRSQWQPTGMDAFVAKPIFSRGGENVTVVKGGRVIAQTQGTYGRYPMIYQELAELAEFDGRRVVLGSWVVGGKAAGMIVREGGADGIIVDRSACVPHLIA